MGGENKRGELILSKASSSSSERECEDVGLGLRMQSTESFPNKRMIAMPHLPPTPPLYHHNYKNTTTTTNNNNSNYSYSISSPYYHFENMSSSTSIAASAVDGGFGVGVGVGVGCGPPLYNNSNLRVCNNNNNNHDDYKNNKVHCLSDDLYDVVGAAASTSVSVQRNFLPLGRGEMWGNSNKGNGYFTVRQWEELERQIVICKYMMASIPVPADLLLTLSNSTTSPCLLSSSQSNHNTTSCRLDVRYTRGGGNDLEPWRCRRTDGKKWRCSRDVAPYQKYCERHAHKPRPRSRKPVEPPQQQCHVTNSNNNNNNDNNNNNNDDSTALPPHGLRRQVFDIPAMISEATYAQPRCTEWFLKGDPIPGSSLNEQWQHLVQPSPRVAELGLKLYNDHESIHTTNTYIRTNDDSSFQNQTTRHFIDAWSCPDREVTNQTSPLSLPMSSSLSLSMSGGGATENDDDNSNNENNEKNFKPDWQLDTDTYACMQPGGPLGEALCLGISSCSSGKGQSGNFPSPHGYSTTTTTTTTTSSCRKS